MTEAHFGQQSFDYITFFGTVKHLLKQLKTASTCTLSEGYFLKSETILRDAYRTVRTLCKVHVLGKKCIAPNSPSTAML